MKCAICDKNIPKNRYRWVAGWRKADGVIGPKGFESEFCSADCFIEGAHNVEAWDFEQKLAKSFMASAGEEVDGDVEYFISPLIV